VILKKFQELSLDFLKRYIGYARGHCAPRISDKASKLLLNQYVQMRNPLLNDQHQLMGRSKSMRKGTHYENVY
jgi:DNA replicative helicase MCM subunit Mcm2 (Cdc46/Mcm family)